MFHHAMRGDTLSLLHWNHIPVVPHEAVPEVSKGKVHITQNKHVPIGIDCDFLNTFQSTKCYKVLVPTTPYYKVLLRYYSSTTKNYSSSIQYYSVRQSTTPYYKVLLQYYKKSLQYYKI